MSYSLVQENIEQSFHYDNYCFLFSLENLLNPISVDPLQTSTSTASTTSLSPNLSVDTSNISQIPSPPSTTNDNRSELLDSITDFSLSRLKKAQINDRSAPKFK